jgi:hypothetical protein
MDKLIRDGKVAVLISTGWGAGWSTWNTESPEMLFDPTLVQMVEDDADMSELVAYAEKQWPNAYHGGLDELVVLWIEQGTEFRVTEYDGAESIQIKQDINWIVA